MQDVSLLTWAQCGMCATAECRAFTMKMLCTQPVKFEPWMFTDLWAQ